MAAPGRAAATAGERQGELSVGELSVGELRDGQVHAWIMGLDTPINGTRSLLSATELERAASYLSPLDGARFAASRAGLRRILGCYLGADPAALRFDTGASGRPTVAARPTVAGQHGLYEQHRLGLELQFSLARSAGMALLAVSAGAVGADVEVVLPRAGLADLAEARFGPAEAACIERGCAGSSLRSFYRHWTAREAWLKAIDVGLAALRDTEYDCRPVPAVRFRDSPGPMPELRLHLLDIHEAHVAAVAAAGPLTGWRVLPSGPLFQ